MRMIKIRGPVYLRSIGPAERNSSAIVGGASLIACHLRILEALWAKDDKRARITVTAREILMRASWHSFPRTQIHNSTLHNDTPTTCLPAPTHQHRSLPRLSTSHSRALTTFRLTIHRNTALLRDLQLCPAACFSCLTNLLIVCHHSLR